MAPLKSPRGAPSANAQLHYVGLWCVLSPAVVAKHPYGRGHTNRVFGKPVFCPLPKRGRFDENGKNDEFAFYHWKQGFGSSNPRKRRKWRKWRVSLRKRHGLEKAGFVLPWYGKDREITEKSLHYDNLISCSFCHLYFVKEFPLFGRKISAKNRLISANLG